MICTNLKTIIHYNLHVYFKMTVNEHYNLCVFTVLANSIMQIYFSGDCDCY